MIGQVFLILIIASATLAQEAVSQKEFGQDALLAHNLYRKIHGVPALKLNPELSKIALQRAQELTGAGTLNVKQNSFQGSVLGETVGSVEGFSEYNGISATQLWYSVVSKFDENGETSAEGASFTQIIWKGTQEVGFGVSKTSDGKFFFVAEYFPSGNIRGQYENNVFQLTDELVKQAACTVSPIHESNIVKTVVPIEKDIVEPVLLTTEAPVKLTTESLTEELPVLTTVAPVEEDQVLTTKRVRVHATKSTTVEPEIELTTIAVPVVVSITRVALTAAPVESTTQVLGGFVVEEVENTTTSFVPSVTRFSPTSTQQVLTFSPELDLTTESPFRMQQIITISTRRHTTTTTVAPEVEETVVEVTTLAHSTRILTTTEAVEVESQTEQVVRVTTPRIVSTTTEVEVEETTRVPVPVTESVEFETTVEMVTTAKPSKLRILVPTTVATDEVEQETTTQVVQLEETTVISPIKAKKPVTVGPVEESEDVVEETTVALPIKAKKPVTVGPVEESEDVVEQTTVALPIKAKKPVTVGPVEESEDVVEETTTVLPVKAKKLVSSVTESEVVVEETTTPEITVEETTPQEVVDEELTSTVASSLKRLTLNKKAHTQ